MPQFVVQLEGGGEMRVNASSQEAANNNVQGTGNAVAGSSSGNTSGSSFQTTAGSEPAAADGQKLSQQSPSTQQAFIAAYGQDGAGQAWVNEHNAAIGARPVSSGGGGGGTPGGAVYATGNGTKTQGQMFDELRSAGYNGPTDDASIRSAYARTTGAPVTAGGGTTQKGAGAGTTAAAGTPAGARDPRIAELEASLNRMAQNIASGNDRAFFEGVRQFDLMFGLDRDKFDEDIRQFNESLGLKQGELTGTYQGAPTLANLKQQGDFGMQALKLGSELQANPFRQQEVLGSLGRLLSGAGVSGFSAPNTVQGVGVAGGLQPGGTGMGYLQQMIDDIRDPVPNQQRMDQVLAGIPTPNKVDSVNFLRAPQSTQSVVLQGMQEKYGINPDDALKQIQNTLPQFTAPTTVGTIRR
jgi:hypothetical protein